MRLELILVLLAHALRAVGDPTVGASRAQELGAAFIGQRLLGRIEDLHEVPRRAVGGQRLDVLTGRSNGIEEIAEQQRTRVARQMRLGRLGEAECGVGLVCEDRLGDARGGLAAGGRLRKPEKGDALSSAHQQLGRGQHEHDGALALRRVGEMAFEIHGGGQVRPQPDRVRRLPLALAHVEMVGARRAPPVDLPVGVARPELAKLPEGLAGAGAAAAVNAVRDRLRDALGLDEDVGQTVGETLRLAFQCQDPGPFGEIPARRRGGVRHSLLHCRDEPGDDGG